MTVHSDPPTAMPSVTERLAAAYRGEAVKPQFYEPSRAPSLPELTAEAAGIALMPMPLAAGEAEVFYSLVRALRDHDIGAAVWCATRYPPGRMRVVAGALVENERRLHGFALSATERAFLDQIDALGEASASIYAAAASVVLPLTSLEYQIADAVMDRLASQQDEHARAFAVSIDPVRLEIVLAEWFAHQRQQGDTSGADVPDADMIAWALRTLREPAA